MYRSNFWAIGHKNPESFNDGVRCEQCRFHGFLLNPILPAVNHISAGKRRREGWKHFRTGLDALHGGGLRMFAVGVSGSIDRCILCLGCMLRVRASVPSNGLGTFFLWAQTIITLSDMTRWERYKSRSAEIESIH